MVLDMVGVGTVATGGDRLDEVVVFVLLLHLVVAQEHICIDAGRVGAWLALGKERHFVQFRFIAVEVCQEAEFVEGVVLIEVVELAGDFLSAGGDKGGTDVAEGREADDDGLVCTGSRQGIGDADGERLLCLGSQGEGHQQEGEHLSFHTICFSRLQK